MKTSQLPLILVTNDDGIASPGLRAAAQALDDLGEVLVVAPLEQQSGMGRSLPAGNTGRITPHPLSINGRTLQGYAVQGAPAQAVQHAVIEIAPRKPALVVAGINYGENIGSGLTISGTVGAALEGASYDIPAIAISLQTAPEHYMSHSEEVDFSAAARVLRRFARDVLANGLPAGVEVLKIDVPRDATPDTPWRWTRSSRRRYFAPVKPKRARLSDPGRMGYISQVDPKIEPDSDVYALMVDKVISVTPITEDLTARTYETLVMERRASTRSSESI